MAMEEKEYLEYLKSFTDTKKDSLRYIPKFRGVKDYDYVDEHSDANKVVGHSSKWFVRLNKMYFKEMIRDVQKNASSSYETCYRKDEIQENNVPEYVSVLIKEPDRELELDADVFGSRVLNHFGLPVVFNRRIDKAIPRYPASKYLVSVDFLRPNEEFVPLNEIVEFGKGIDIKRYETCGLKKTISNILPYLEKSLNENGISFSKQDIKNFENYLVSSFLVRVILLGDDDFRNGNVGILINRKDNTFRPAPNFDMEKSFIYRGANEKLKNLPQIYNDYPELFGDFVEKTYYFVCPDKAGESPCYRLAKKSIKNENDRGIFVDCICGRASEIFEKCNQIVAETQSQPN